MLWPAGLERRPTQRHPLSRWHGSQERHPPAPPHRQAQGCHPELSGHRTGPTTAGQSQRALRECQDREGLGRTWSTVVSDSQQAPRGQLGTRRDTRLSAGLRVSDGGGRGTGGRADSFQALMATHRGPQASAINNPAPQQPDAHKQSVLPRILRTPRSRPFTGLPDLTSDTSWDTGARGRSNGVLSEPKASLKV